jgi:predicted murein hydrolase (TIGR00659 family)
MTEELHRIWVYLAASPLFALTATLVAYQAGAWLYERSGRKPFVNPVLIAVLVLVALLLATDTPYGDYFEGAQFVHFMLGPATVALAVPLKNQLRALRGAVLATATAIVAGSLTAITSALGIAWALGGTAETLVSLAPKSVTTPIAMALSDRLGGLASLTAVAVIITGMVGAIAGGWLLDRCRITDQRARGLAIGVAAHGIGTARAFQVSETAGAFAGLAMGLNALATTLFFAAAVALLG